MADLDTLLARLTPAEREEWQNHLNFYGTASIHENKDGSVRVVPPWEIFRDDEGKVSLNVPSSQDDTQ